MKLFADGRSANVEVYGMTLVARNSLGETQRSYPVLSHPPASDAAGVLSTMPIKSLFIDELLSKPGFKLLLLNCDGANTNRKAVRMIMAELQPKRDLLVLVNFCASHGVNNAVRWGLGQFSYGNVLRCCHVLQSVKNRNFPSHVRKCLRSDIAGDAVLLTDTAQDYVKAVWDEYAGVFKDPDTLFPIALTPPMGGQGEEDAKPSGNLPIWKRFIKLVTGQKGPFATSGKKRIPGYFRMSHY